MPLLRYDAELRSKVPDDCTVAKLCDGDFENYEKHARALERWFVDVNASKALWRDLVCADNGRFEGARWHLTIATLFDATDFTVDFHHKLGGKTPDLGITKDGHMATIEIFHTARKDETEVKHSLSNELAERLQERVRFDKGFLSISLFADLPEVVPEDEITYMADRINEWLEQGAPDFLAVHRKRHFLAALMPYDDERLVGVAGGDSQIDPKRTYAKACESQVRTKLDRYGPVAERPIVLVICNDEFDLSAWRVDDILFGDAGVLNRDSKNRHPHADEVAGVILARREVFDESTGSWPIDARFMPNPDTTRPLPAGWFAPITERQSDDTWTPYKPGEQVITLK